MIDGFKFRITNKGCIQALLSHPSLDLRINVSLNTGEVCSGYKEAKYRGLRIECNHEIEIFIRGNLYEYYTGQKNYQNFELKDALEALRMLESDLQIDLTKAEVIKLEWGLNVSLPETISVNRFIENILVYKGHMPNYKQYPGGGIMRTFDLNEFFIKIYDKGIQSKKLSNLLRFELAARRKTFLRRIGIYYASDLLNNSSLKKLHSTFLKLNTHIIFCDNEIDMIRMKSRDLKLLSQLNKPLDWHCLMKKNPELYRKKKPLFRKKITELSGIDWNKYLDELIKDESTKLLS